jgi:hypothetical protein
LERICNGKEHLYNACHPWVCISSIEGKGLLEASAGICFSKIRESVTAVSVNKTFVPASGLQKLMLKVS